MVSETFQRLPLRKLVDYYKIVKNPVSLHGVGRSVKNAKYNNAQEFVTDLAQIAWNARLYNVRGSFIYAHALILNAYILEKVIPKLASDKSLGQVYYPDLGPLPEGDEPVAGAILTGGEGSPDEEEYEDDDTQRSIIQSQPQIQSLQQPSAPTPQSQQQSPPPIQYTPQPYVGGGGYSLQGSPDVSVGPNDHHLSALAANNALTNKLNTRGPSPYGAVGTAPISATPAASGIRRGRPPIIDKPYETRIKLILKQFKKLRLPNDPSYNLTTNFDRLPDPKYNSSYYAVVKTPISLFEIRTKVRTRKYHTVDEFISDINLMFSNTKFFYSNDQLSPVYQEALLFEQEANKIIHQELSKPEKDLLTANTPGGDGIIRIPLDSLDVEGYTYRIGDWVLIKNANDPTRPTVGQIFRLWATEDGTKYTNVCWYYRPEQTCHRVDRLFFTNEVCKTGQYRDHLASEIVGPCYVIFLTRYQKGDLPEGVIPQGCPWFICEFRYNENSHVFNRIRTWKACLPDEIRDKSEQPLLPLHEPRKLIKFDSPIRNLLPNGVDSHMQILDATPGPNPNTPPIVGSVYLRGAADDDELGQYSSSPNVVRSAENDNAGDGRTAYLFTPPSQAKMSGSMYPPHSSHVPPSTGNSGLSTPIPFNNNNTLVNNNSGLNNTTNLVGTGISGSSIASATPATAQGYYDSPVNTSGLQGYNNSIVPGNSVNSGVAATGATGSPYGANKVSYAASMSIYKQHLQQQQQQHQQYQQHRYAVRQEAKRAVTPTMSAPASVASNTYTSAATSIYSNALIGGILAYSTVDETDSLIELTEGINNKKRKIQQDEDEEDEEVTEIVWYRAPPISIQQRILTSNGKELGHSAKYLAWKASQNV
ncbi:chromatin structure-remodeling complex subunit Rsc2p [[Candida] anglica]|uniref:Chromatin structure-remodeling complex subunit Rsc2p n=1 Tax=[Candida] anglica TaxID=148631 RepID=A0ABP0EIW6_9ASCO